LIIRDILEAKSSIAITIQPCDTIAALSELLRENRIGAAVVSVDGVKIAGVISERDIAYGLSIHQAVLSNMPVSELMTETVITCSPNDQVGRVASTMLSRNIRHLPVEENGHLVGMVSIRDILKERVGDLQKKTALLQNFVKGIDREPQDRE
jgi:CBS domain-containing protein